ncbi:MAG: diaminopimelate decarboxylase [Elusimicrobia bacterium]|nr:diaminopimelate decarboxylase [Elusimicrobiota bacterium]
MLKYSSTLFMNKYFPQKIIKEIVKKISTPVYIYSREKLIKNFKAYQKAFSNFDTLICYALKANSNKAVCSELAWLAAGADAVSGGELFRALRAGFKPEKIVFSGAGKTREEIEYALTKRILMINAESFEELLVLEKTAKKLKTAADFSVRINPDIDPHTHKFITTGKAGTKFGVAPAEAFEMYLYSKKSKFLNPVGIHCHLGSQIDSAGPYKLALQVVAGLAKRLSSAGIFLKYVDIGGGWAVSERNGKMKSPEILFKTLSSGMASLNGVKLIIEPGRSLIASAGILATKVLYRKKSGKKNFVIVDAGMNDFIRPAFYGAEHLIIPLVKRKGKQVNVDVAGPVCETADLLGKNVKMPLPEQDDLLILYPAGAYGFSMSSQYNSRPRPAEVMVCSANKWQVIRKRETYRDLIAGEK